MGRIISVLGFNNCLLEDKMICTSFTSVSKFSIINLNITIMYWSHIYVLGSAVSFFIYTLNLHNKGQHYSSHFTKAEAKGGEAKTFCSDFQLVW